MNSVLGYRYLAATGQLDTRCIGTSATQCTLLSFDYGYDSWGNLASQQEHAFAPGRTETFEYDTLHRHTRTTRSTMPQAEVIYGYDAAGNLTEKSDFAELYTYANDSNRLTETSKGAVTDADATYAYDGNGNQTERRGSSAQLTRLSTYDIHNRPERVRSTDNPAQTQGSLTFRYGPSGDRYLQRTGQPESANFPRVTLYPFAGYEVDGTIPPTSQTRFTTVRQHLGGYGLRRSVYTGAVPETVWLHTDRLGSVVAKTDQNGAVAMNATNNGHAERHGYDAFGRPRRGSWEADVVSGPSAGQPGNQGVMQSQYSRRGFTGHEHLDDSYGQHKLIHMNGRMYDPLLGRFLGVDPIIQFPANGQSLNPYSYIMNNPMAGTDPTGYCSAPVGSKIKTCDVKITRTLSDGSQRTQSFNSNNPGDMARAVSTVTTAEVQMMNSGAPAAGAITAATSGRNASQGEGNNSGTPTTSGIGQFKSQIYKAEASGSMRTVMR